MRVEVTLRVERLPVIEHHHPHVDERDQCHDKLRLVEHSGRIAGVLVHGRNYVDQDSPESLKHFQQLNGAAIQRPSDWSTLNC